MSVSPTSSVTDTNFDGDLTDEDIDPLFSLFNILSDVSEEVVDWYEQRAEDFEVASEWYNWLGEATSNHRTLDKDESERIEFTEWLNYIGFDYDKYFDVNDDIITARDADYANDEVMQLIALAVESISSDTDQSSLIASAVIDDFNGAADELGSFIDTFLSTGRGHLQF